MAGKNLTVFGIYRDESHVVTAIDSLLEAGFRNEDISLLVPDNEGTKDFAHERHTKLPEGTASGGVAGGVIGGTIGLLAGAGTLAIPGLGPFIAAGPIMAALAGAGAGGALGGVVGALAGMGIPEYEAKRYDGLVKEGHVLASVHCDNSEWVNRAKERMKATGGEDISSTSEARADFGKTDKPMPRTRSSAGF